MARGVDIAPANGTADGERETLTAAAAILRRRANEVRLEAVNLDGAFWAHELETAATTIDAEVNEDPMRFIQPHYGEEDDDGDER
jgi:hypothetical protein